VQVSAADLHSNLLPVTGILDAKRQRSQSAGEPALHRDHLVVAEILGALQNVPDGFHADRLINQQRSCSHIRPIKDSPSLTAIMAMATSAPVTPPARRPKPMRLRTMTQKSLLLINASLKRGCLAPLFLA
jgi:hypothetical protein